MKQFSSEKYNVAWFKLAECVSKGEKERTLGVYRLLAHSIGDDALSTQLYADILLSFEDKEGAVQKYLQAASLYKKENKITQAVAIYEHLIFLQPDYIENLIELCDLYLKIGMQSKASEHLDKLVKNKKFNLKNQDFLDKLKVEREDFYNYFLKYLG